MTYQNLSGSTGGTAVPAGTAVSAVLEVNQEEVARTYPHTKRVGNYLLGKTIGEGSFAKVKEGVHVLSGEKVAVKVIDKKKAREDAYVRRNMRREGRLLQLVRHRNVIQLFDTLETENSYYLVTEYCGGGDLMTRICNRRRLDETETRKYVRQISSAVDYLHKAGIIHRDLKVENLLLDEAKDIKIIDFGLSNSFRLDDSTDGSGSVTTTLCVTQCGSPAYAAPELLSNAKYGPEIDVWSIGVNMYAMLTGNLPFTVEPFTIKALHSKMVNGDMNPLPDQLSKGCRHLLKRFLTADPEKRIVLSEAIRHPWLTERLNRAIEEAPFPNRLSAVELNQAIVRHMATHLDFKLGDVIRHVTSNIPSSATATYHLLHHRMIRCGAARRPASGLRRDAQQVGQRDILPPPPPAEKDDRLKTTSPDPGTSVAHVTPSPQSSSAIDGSGGKTIDRNTSSVSDDFPVDSTRKPEHLRDDKVDDVTGERVVCQLLNSVDSEGACNEQSNNNNNVLKTSVIKLKRQSDPGDYRGNDSRHLPNDGSTASVETDLATSEDKENNIAKTVVTPTKPLKNGRRKQELDDVRFYRLSLTTKTRTSTPNAQKSNAAREEILDLATDRPRNPGRPGSRQKIHASDLPLLLLPTATAPQKTTNTWTPLQRTPPSPTTRPKPPTPGGQSDPPPLVSRHPPRRHLPAAALGYGLRPHFRSPMLRQEVTSSGPETAKRYLIDVAHYDRYARCDERGGLYCTNPRPQHTWRSNQVKLTSQPPRGQATERRATFAAGTGNGTRSVDRKIRCDNRRSFGNDLDLLTLKTDSEQDRN